MKEKLAERIRLARLMKGLSQQNLADELGITVASYSNIERGVTEISVVRLYAISKILNISITSFFEENIDKPINLIKEPTENFYTKNEFNLNEIIEELKHQKTEINKLNSEVKKLKNKNN